MGHTAFELHSVIENIPVKIESLAVWQDCLYVGTTEGVLLIYNISYLPAKQAENPKKRFNYSLVRTQKDFVGKKPITQLCALPELGQLVSLSDGYIRLHTLGVLREVDTLKNTKGQNIKGKVFVVHLILNINSTTLKCRM
jgi:hypothetical protein